MAKTSTASTTLAPATRPESDGIGVSPGTAVSPASPAAPIRATATRPDSTLIGRHRLGGYLRSLRHARSLRLEEVAAELGIAPSTLSRIETGQAPARTSYVSIMLDLYAVDDPDRRRFLADLAREGQRKGWRTIYQDLLPTGAA